jgi:RecA-family ATPase
MTDVSVTLDKPILPTEGFQFYQGSNYLALPRDPQPWLIEKLIPIGATNLYGKPKAGKSYLALGIAFAISCPAMDEFMGHRVIKHGPVMYLQVDTPREEWALRIEKIKDAQWDIENVHFTDSHLVPYPVDITVQYIKDKLKEAIFKIKPIVLVVDTLREVHEGDEDKSAIMKKVVTSLVECTRETNTSLLLLSHSRKENPQYANKSDLMDDNRGSGYTAGRMDMIIKLTEKQMMLKGRSIIEKRIAVEQDSLGMVVLNRDKADSEGKVKQVLAMPQLTSDRQRADMLASIEDNLTVEAARSRIRQYKEKHKMEGDES